MPYPYKTIREWVAEEENLGNVLRIKTPIKCGDYSNIVDIGNDIPGKQPETELRALVRYLHSLPGKPIGIIEKPVNNRPDMPLITNMWPTEERTLRGMGLKNKYELCEKLKVMKSNSIKPLQVAKGEALCKEVIIPEERIDLRTDIPRCWVEFNQMLWSTCNGTVIMYDPQTGRHDLGKVRVGQYEWEDANPDTPFSEERVKKYVFCTLQYLGNIASDAGRYYYNNYMMKNKVMPAAFCFGVPTDLHTVAGLKAALKWLEQDCDYEALGGFRGEPVEVVEAETIPNLMVPAHAEWVIEGEFQPDIEIMPPYAEDVCSGYMVGSESCPIFRVKCITHRRDPWWTATTFSSNGLNGHEGVHAALSCLQSEADAINYLRRAGFKVKDVVCLDLGREVVVIQLEVDGVDKPGAWYGKQVAMALYSNVGTMCGPPTKYIIVVGPDIDPYDFKDVMWAVGTRTMPVSDSIMIEKGLAQYCDPGGIPGPIGWKVYGEQMLIDATIKIPERHDTWPPRSEPVEWEREAIKRMKQRLA